MKLKKGDKVYFTKESAPDFKTPYLTIEKQYEVLSIDGEFFKFLDDNGVLRISLPELTAYLNGGTWLKVKTKKRKLEKEIEDLHRKLETTEQLLKVSRERIDEYKVEKLRLVYEILQTLGDVTFDVKEKEDKYFKHTFELTINN